MKSHRTIQSAPGFLGWKVDSQATNPTKELFIGVALTGAKFTPLNHKKTGDTTLDQILKGNQIVVDPEQTRSEINRLYTMGVRYFHWHARNPETREQSSCNRLYHDFGTGLRQENPEIVLSYGGSRNGKEIAERIRTHGEWDRLSQAALSREAGGADFVTIQAAAELMIAVDMERQGYLRYHLDTDEVEVLRDLTSYVASAKEESLSIGAHSTSGGSNYGSSTANRQLEVFRRAIESRGLHDLPQEVEWTQLQRSHMMTKIAVEHLRPGLGNTGRLNITILFGFSPKLPFPLTYDEFRKAIEMAQSIGRSDAVPDLNVSVSVGAAVMPQKALELYTPLDIGSDRGRPVSPLERLIAYACMHDSGVDLLRFGLEDTPYLMGDQGEVLPVTNTELGSFTFLKLKEYGGIPIVDRERVNRFVATKAKRGTVASTDT